MSVEGIYRFDHPISILLLLFFVFIGCYSGVRMGRIPKLVKEKAFAERHLSSSSSIENDEQSSSTVVSSSPYVSLINSISNNLTSTDIDLELILNDDVLLTMLSSCTNYKLPENFTIDETKCDHKGNLFVLNDSILRDYTSHDHESFAMNVIEYIKKFSTKINFKINKIKCSDEDLFFMQYLQKKIFNLCNIYNDCTRKLVKRMNSMIKYGVNSIIHLNLFIFN